MAKFLGVLNSNEITGVLYNMIISQETFAGNIKGTVSMLVDRARVDGGLFGDQKLYVGTDVLGSEPWGNDAEASNLLDLDRPTDPNVQTIKLDVFRQIRLTNDYYLSKRAWGTEGAFAQFTSVLMAWIGDTKRVYDSTTYNTFIGTHETTLGKQKLTVTVNATKKAQSIAQFLADLYIDMQKPTRDYNDNGNLRSYAESEIQIIWNSKFVNEIRNIDLPTIFHTERLESKITEDILPKEYFGDRQEEIQKSSNDGTYRSLVEKDYNVLANGTRLKRNDSRYVKALHVFPGDLIPSNEVLTQKGFLSENIPAKTCYKVNDKIICKVVTQLPPYMSSFEVGTSFMNPRALNENHYLTFGRNTLEHLADKPFITLVADK